MDPQKLHEIDENLISSDVAQLKFLCMDLIPKKRLETVMDAKDLFVRLEEQALLEDKLLVPELLITIGRRDSLFILDKSKELWKEVEKELAERDNSSKGVSAYRKMLLKLSEDMTAENLNSVKFLLELPRAKVGNNASFLDVAIEMEKQQRLGEDNLQELYDVLQKCDKQLSSRIEEFRNKHRGQEQGGRVPEQEAFSIEHPLPIVEIERGGRRISSVGSLVTDSDPPHMIPALDKEYYSLTQRPLGHCIIFNNFNFEGSSKKLLNRKGTEKDREDLEQLFNRMHFEVDVYDDLEASNIKDKIKKFAKKDHSQMGAFVCCVLSHGEKGAVLGTDGKPVEIRELTTPFAECLSLAGKPKLFFIQACQGGEAQNGIWAEDGQLNNTEEGTFEGDAYNPALRSVPTEADILIGMATVEHYQSFRHTKQGSIYIQELCKQLELSQGREDILSILTKVNREVSTKVLKGHKQMPEPRYTLTRKLVLPID